MLKRVYLEITNACNLDCPFCTYNKGNKYLSFDEICNYLSQIKQFTNFIYLHILGEPTLHPRFEDVLNLLDTKDFNLQLVTNGTLLYKYPDILKHKCLRKLSISMHAVSDVNISDTYFKTIDRLIEENVETKLELRFYNTQNLDNKLKDYLTSLKQRYKYEETVRKNSYEIKKNTYIYYADMFSWPNINDDVIGYHGTCHGANDMIAINANSDVTICCLDPTAYSAIGNLKKNTLYDILHSDAYAKYVVAFRENRIISELCARCSYRLRFDGKHSK